MRIGAVVATLLLLATLHGQERTVPAAVQPFVSVDAPVVALTHVQLMTEPVRQLERIRP